MNTSRALLRILILAGCLPLLARYARVTPVRAHTEDCTQIDTTATTYGCPPGCTSATYATYLTHGAGFQYADQNPTPCSPSTCSQPFALGPPTQECVQCCLGPGQDCGDLCNGDTVCCGECNGVQCCNPEGYDCSIDGNCCDGLVCRNGLCKPPCSQLAEYCDSTQPCCSGLLCENNACCVQTYDRCTYDSDCCTGNCQSDGICGPMIQGPA